MDAAGSLTALGFQPFCKKLEFQLLAFLLTAKWANETKGEFR